MAHLFERIARLLVPEQQEKPIETYRDKPDFLSGMAGYGTFTRSQLDSKIFDRNPDPWADESDADKELGQK